MSTGPQDGILYGISPLFLFCDTLDILLSFNIQTAYLLCFDIF